ncbi:antibiotic biosynthesis monooxygenase [Roseicyclus sp. F158]|uniref:Antibiotic biosynthesis monooxygenase n=1 Tax=Tropicimonas omnivorans TaxID=3075590 RepID=A0ABU3DLL5_9RHOB|nr:antibiotic biosynthesis monooxygenase [Roseicyclus sp. F158]MDT0684595.1 antibiotic biosynthesis monooxygenase [Roseicyclus sp. F158]
MTRSMMARATPKPGQEGQLRALVEDLACNVRAEPGNIRFEAFAEDGGAMVMLEEYRDDTAFEAHLGMPHTRQFNAALKEVAAGGGPKVTNVADVAADRHAAPGIRGIDHAGLTVPDIEAATRFFAEAFGAVTLYDVLPQDGPDMSGEGPEAELGLTSGTRIVHMRLVRIGNGPCLELFRMEDGDQADPARLQDKGLTHIGLYVDDIDAACTAFTEAGGMLLKGPHPLANNENQDGNAGIYGRAPWGMLIELLTYPGGIDMPADAPAIRWTPHP